MCEVVGTDLGDPLHPVNRMYYMHAGVGYTLSWSQAIII